MATVKPFAALRPKPELASQICELPYDVLSSEEARALASRNPLSFFHVSKPEVDLEPGANLYEPRVYEKGRANFRSLIDRQALIRDQAPCFYLYRQTMGTHSQLGVVAVTSCDEYQRGIIKKHELTRPDKEDDRVRHIETLNAQTGPAFLVYRAQRDLDSFLAEKATAHPDIDFTASDGIRHTCWNVSSAADVAWIEAAFGRISELYIADGHHRSAAAARVCQARKGQGHARFFLSVVFPHTQMQILPYHRVVKDLNGMTPDQFLRALEKVVAVVPSNLDHPAQPHDVCLYLAGRWYSLSFPSNVVAHEDSQGRLDVALLQKHVLSPLLGITDPRTSQRINFVGGIRGPKELVRLVESGDFRCAFAMFPTQIEDLMVIADEGGIMPPKSTWFEPKLRDGLFSHLLA